MGQKGQKGSTPEIDLSKVSFVFNRSNYQLGDMITAVVVRPSAALRVASSIPAWNKYLYDLHVLVPGVVVCICDFFMFVNAPTTQELILV